mgnify:CR=1 FL=1
MLKNIAVKRNCNVKICRVKIETVEQACKAAEAQKADGKRQMDKLESCKEIH